MDLPLLKTLVPSARKWLLFLPLILVLRIPAVAQTATLHEKGVTIRQVLELIRQQTNYALIFSPVILEDAPRIDLDCRHMPIRQVLNECFAGLRLSYEIDNRSILIYRKPAPDGAIYLPLQGRIQNAEGEPINGASVVVGYEIKQHTLINGTFSLPVRSRETTISIFCKGYYPHTITLNNTIFQVITLPVARALDRVIIQAYGNTTKRLATASVAEFKSSGMETAASGNIMEVLKGKLPGMVIRQYNGVPGSAYGLLIRGRHSISQSTDPLVVVDGVPLATDNGFQSTIGAGSAQGPMGASTFNGIPLSVIASVEVLKDAAATSIYGSRGANGVVLLTLRKPVAGGSTWGAEVWSGSEETVKTSPLLNTPQYLALRKEAVKNDGFDVTPQTVPEAYDWDSSRYSNFKKEVQGHTAPIRNVQIDFSTAGPNTSLLLSGNDHRETAVFPGETGDNRISGYGYLHHRSDNLRLALDLSALYSVENNQLPIQDYTPLARLAPNAPAFQNVAGQPVWSENGLPFVNILAQQHNSYRATVNTELTHLQLGYELTRGLWLRGSFGYSHVLANERSQVPISGQDPATAPTGSTWQIVNSGASELAEGYADYKKQWKSDKLEALLGATWQQQEAAYSAFAATGYQSDLLLETGGGNPIVTSSSTNVFYRYAALFGRLNYILDDRWILTLSGRRDGSSRFGPGNQFGNFGAIGAAWIFSGKGPSKNSSWLSFGKIRGSLGTTGNDPVSENGYSQLYAGTNAARGYQGLQGVVPVSLANPRLRWEVNYNSELALDLGFLDNRIFLSVAGYLDWTGNQLLYNYLPGQTGLPGVVMNVPVCIVNEGLEFALQTDDISLAGLLWSSSYNVTVPVNRLTRFPGLAHSGYATTLAVGRSLSVINGYHYEGVNAQSGLFQFRNDNGNGTPGPADIFPGGNLDQRYYGGTDQRLHYKGWELELFFEFRVQNGYNPYAALYKNNPPGMPAPDMLGNGPTEWLHHWRQPGDKVPLQRLTSTTGSIAYERLAYFVASDAQGIDASFLRWKGLTLSWQLPKEMLKKLALRDCKIWLRGQNLLTFSHFPVTDPETQDPGVLPPVRSMTAGIRMNF